MAAILIKNTQHWVGTAAERAAMSTTGIYAGSTFEETDTGLIYKWSGSAWFIGGGETVGVIQATHDSLNGNANIQVANTDVGNTNPVPITDKKTSTAPGATPVTIPVTAGGTTILAANANRISATLQNTGTEPCIIRLGGNPSTTAYNFILAEDTGVRIGAGGSRTINNFTGEIKGITEANTTTIAVEELV